MKVLNDFALSFGQYFSVFHHFDGFFELKIVETLTLVSKTWLFLATPNAFSLRPNHFLHKFFKVNRGNRGNLNKFETFFSFFVAT